MEQIVITGIQIRAALGILNWSQNKLAEASGVGITTINKLVKVDGVRVQAEFQTLKAVFDTLDSELRKIGAAIDPNGIVKLVNSSASVDKKG